MSPQFPSPQFSDGDERAQEEQASGDATREAGASAGIKIGLLPLSALYGRTSKSAEESKARQIRAELAMTGEERVELALRLGKRRYAP